MTDVTGEAKSQTGLPEEQALLRTLSSSEMPGQLVPRALPTTHCALASGAGSVGANASVGAVFVKNDTALELANIVASHAVDMRATQLSNGATVQIVNEAAVVKCDRRSRFSVDVAYHD